MAAIPGSRIYFEPLSDLDRTMDVTHGLLDTLCNPRSGSRVLQALNTVMFSRSLKVSKHSFRLQQVNGLKALQLSTDTSTYTLLLDSGSESTVSEALNVEAFLDMKEGEPLKIYQLSQITLKSIKFYEAENCISLTPDQTPILIESPPIDSKRKPL